MRLLSSSQLLLVFPVFSSSGGNVDVGTFVRKQ